MRTKDEKLYQDCAKNAKSDFLLPIDEMQSESYDCFYMYIAVTFYLTNTFHLSSRFFTRLTKRLY